MDELKVYDPLDYDNLTVNLVRELMSRGPYRLPLEKPFKGPGVYALFYNGDFKPYQQSRSKKATWPLYVGMAVMPGARKGGPKEKSSEGSSLFGRIKEHSQSIEAAKNLDIADFSCRFLVVVPLWITMAERFLIEHYRPIWNVCVEGFGLHDPGGGRRKGEISWWDALHPGRQWAKLQQQTRQHKEAIERLKGHYASGKHARDLIQETSEAVE